VLNGLTTSSTSDTRSFVTPLLPSGDDYAYYYDARVEVRRGGRTLAVEKRLHFRAGETRDFVIEIPEGVTIAQR
jgi:uncharacterized protein (TIGR03000 family)